MHWPTQHESAACDSWGVFESAEEAQAGRRKEAPGSTADTCASASASASASESESESENE